MRWKTLPGFVTFNEFFEEVQRHEFKPIRINEDLKKALPSSISRICDIKMPNGETSSIYSNDQFTGLVDDWRFTSSLKEVRMRNEFSANQPSIYCRFEVDSLLPDGQCDYNPTNLCILLNDEYFPLSYTIVKSDGRINPDFNVYSEWASGVGIEFALEELLSHAGRLALAYTIDQAEYIKLTLRRDIMRQTYRLEWHSHDFPFTFYHDNATLRQSHDFIVAFASGGLPAIQEMFPWLHMSLAMSLQTEQSIISQRRVLAREKRNATKGVMK